MAEKNLQSLVLRAAPLAGARATGLESKVVFMAKQDNSAQALSFPWHPLAGRPAVRTGPEADKVRERTWCPDRYREKRKRDHPMGLVVRPGDSREHPRRVRRQPRKLRARGDASDASTRDAHGRRGTDVRLIPARHQHSQSPNGH